MILIFDEGQNLIVLENAVRWVPPILPHQFLSQRCLPKGFGGSKERTHGTNHALGLDGPDSSTVIRTWIIDINLEYRLIGPVLTRSGTDGLYHTLLGDILYSIGPC